jgi:hypothetical protein
VLRRFADLLLLAVLATMLGAAESAKQPFDLPGGLAEQSLKEFARQSGLEVLFVSDSVANVRTNAVKGAFTAREAIRHPPGRHAGHPLRRPARAEDARPKRRSGGAHRQERPPGTTTKP